MHSNARTSRSCDIGFRSNYCTRISSAAPILSSVPVSNLDWRFSCHLVVIMMDWIISERPVTQISSKVWSSHRYRMLSFHQLLPPKCYLLIFLPQKTPANDENQLVRPNTHFSAKHWRAAAFYWTLSLPWRQGDSKVDELLCNAVQCTGDGILDRASKGTRPITDLKFQYACHWERLQRVMNVMNKADKIKTR